MYGFTCAVRAFKRLRHFAVRKKLKQFYAKLLGLWSADVKLPVCCKIFILGVDSALSAGTLFVVCVVMLVNWYRV